MQDKFELLDHLPPELKMEITPYLSTRDLVHLARTSKAHSTFFKPLVDEHKKIHELLGYVVNGEYDKVVSLLKEDITLLYKQGLVKDCSERLFENISAFEYALWALDKHMWTDMLKCIPENIDGNKILQILLLQYNKVNSEGVTYKLNGKPITEQHFDFQKTIIQELQTHQNSVNAPGIKNWNAINKQWQEGVGGAQKLLPMAVVYEYCSDTLFKPVPQFTSKPKLSKQFYNWHTGQNENWFCPESKLGKDLGIYKAGVREAVGAQSRMGRGDLDALTTLYSIRKKDFISLGLQLKQQMTVDNQSQLFQM